MDIGESDYRQGGRERLEESKLLLDSKQFAGSVYLAGRAAEALLRAVIWKSNPEIRTGRRSLEVGHDLRDLLGVVVDLGVLTDEEDSVQLRWDVYYVARLWLNNMRFIPTRKLKTHWWSIGETHKRRTLNMAVRDLYDRCAAIVRRCEALCAN